MKKLMMILVAMVMFACAPALASEHCRLSSSKALYSPTEGQVSYICYYSCPSGYTFHVFMTRCPSQFNPSPFIKFSH